ncbi:helix-turn-helix domain-containing protein [bacterium]|nr:helix-turn-helix domain-containing protein [bacterium]
MAAVMHEDRHPQVPAGPGIGEALRKAREVRAVPVEEIAEITRIRAEFIEALERDTLDRLTAPIFVKGIIQNYCAYLRLDAAPFLAAYNRHLGRRPAEPLDLTPFKPRSAGDRARRFFHGLARGLSVL